MEKEIPFSSPPRRGYIEGKRKSSQPLTTNFLVCAWLVSRFASGAMGLGQVSSKHQLGEEKFREQIEADLDAA